ncbi:MAG: T9SS type A sorting domain-containing protein [Saprospiraceae bacterium]|nr:T9SS type A sorting domain-containing protein [Saprospiraceae bacterium]
MKLLLRFSFVLFFIGLINFDGPVFAQTSLQLLESSGSKNDFFSSSVFVSADDNSLKYHDHHDGSNRPDFIAGTNRLKSIKEDAVKRKKAVSAKAKYRIYPNPGYEGNRIQTAGIKDFPVRISVFDTHGQVISQRTILENTMSSVSIIPHNVHLSLGFYFVRIQSGENTEFHKLVVGK